MASCSNRNRGILPWGCSHTARSGGDDVTALLWRTRIAVVGWFSLACRWARYLLDPPLGRMTGPAVSLCLQPTRRIVLVPWHSLVILFTLLIFVLFCFIFLSFFLYPVKLQIFPSVSALIFSPTFRFTPFWHLTIKRSEELLRDC
jgi:hypothetical protein